MAIGALIRDTRLARGWTQDDLALALNALLLPEGSVTRSDVSRYEHEVRLPASERMVHALSRVLDIPVTLVRSETKLSRVQRREFLSLAALTAVHGSLAREIYASLASGDGGVLATVLTSHGTDRVIASLVEPSAVLRLSRWMRDGADGVLRVNAAGILAKLPGQDMAHQVAVVLRGDEEVQRLYTTAVVARVCHLDWRRAAAWVENPAACGDPARAAAQLTAETLNPRDAGARWCSALMLRDLSPALGAA